ncbi:D-alanyl-D-alanine carboxypeptidase/D-alanyl-D-alanine endopeptidase [Luteococcus sp. Sow4_B9]|uniref:D-alanyl-D-alanine carboxypeptidase/D-alanyl-D-alanine endopeptidase n=1 Tax=Luteococcus sp. Sow4_B9 TaxID=3438792 RepID=UPI003F9BB866
MGMVALAAAVALLTIAGAVFWRPALYASGLWVDGGSPTISPTFFDDPGDQGGPNGHGTGVITAASALPSAPTVNKQTLATALSAVPTDGMGTTSGIALDARTGEVLWQSRQTANLVPASTMKILTSAAALETLGARTTFRTRVVEPAAGTIVLVGGGDPLLASTPSKTYPFVASTDVLAARTAAELKKQGTTSVRLGFDDSLFTGPAWHPSWPDDYHDQVTTVSALWIDKGRPSKEGAPSRTPAQTAATVFAAQLKANGITVAGAPSRVVAQKGARQVAHIESLPVASLVQETLVHSDNSAAEVLLRQVGVATGHGGSFAGGAKGVSATVLGMDPGSPSPRIADGSGLSRSNAASTALLAGVLQHAATTPKLSPLLEGMPVAGVTGTLTMRFYTPESEAGRGIVNAKTGTLSKVSSLAGHTRTRTGAPVVFALASNGAPKEWDVRSWLDRMSTTITTCEC